MNNEPVAWMVQYKGKHDFTFYKPVSHDDAVVVPLYTHPVITPLTEDECEAIINRHNWFSKSWREMAKEIHDAILRKAQEK